MFELDFAKIDELTWSCPSQALVIPEELQGSLFTLYQPLEIKNASLHRSSHI